MTGIPVKPWKPILVEWDNGTQDIVVPLSDRLIGRAWVQRDEDGKLHVFTKHAVRVLQEAK